jgi:hypothetical protein
MSLLHFRVMGYELDDAFISKIIIGGVCGAFLLLLIGTTDFSDWVSKSLIIWIGVTLIIIPLLYAFIEEKLEMKHLIMIVAGILILVIFSIWGNIPSDVVFINILQSIVWMTIFSIILDAFKDKLKGR